MVSVTNADFPQYCSQVHCQTVQRDINGIHFTMSAKDDVVIETVAAKFQKGVTYLQKMGLDLPEIITVNVVSPPEYIRSNASPELQIIHFYSEADVSVAVHELTHIATPNLCAYRGPYHYMLEGFAVWVQHSYQKTDAFFLLKRTVSVEIDTENCSTDNIEEMSDCYTTGAVIWNMIETQYGIDVLLDIVRSVEALDHPTQEEMDSVFVNYTTRTPTEWIENTAKGSWKNYGLLSEANTAFYISDDRGMLSFGVALHRIGSFARATAHLSLLYEKYPEAYDEIIEQYGSSPENWPSTYCYRESAEHKTGAHLGYRVSFSPFFPFTTWKDWEGMIFSIMQPALEVGVAKYSDTTLYGCFGNTSQTDLDEGETLPYVQINLDNFSYRIKEHTSIYAGWSALFQPHDEPDLLFYLGSKTLF